MKQFNQLNNNIKDNKTLIYSLILWARGSQIVRRPSQGKREPRGKY
jgi:hypothetical protein